MHSHLKYMEYIKVNKMCNVIVYGLQSEVT